MYIAAVPAVKSVAATSNSSYVLVESNTIKNNTVYNQLTFMKMKTLKKAPISEGSARGLPTSLAAVLKSITS